MPRAVFLVGFMGAGKTSVGRALAQRLTWIFEDLDDRIEQREARTVPEIFRNFGEPEFRRAERDALQEVLEELEGRGAPRIVALGGGAFVQATIAARLKTARVPTIFLDAPVEELWRRCEQQSGAQEIVRPLLTARDRFAALYQARRERYLRATKRIETAGRSVEAVAEEVARVLLKLAENKD